MVSVVGPDLGWLGSGVAAAVVPLAGDSREGRFAGSHEPLLLQAGMGRSTRRECPNPARLIKAPGSAGLAACSDAVARALHGTVRLSGRTASMWKPAHSSPLPRRLRYRHDLADLLDALAPGDDLLGAGADQQRIAAFIRGFHRLDPRGDQGGIRRRATPTPCR